MTDHIATMAGQSVAPTSHPSVPTPQGLTSADAAERLRQNGPNELPQSAKKGLGALLLEVAREPMFLLLISCGLVYLALGDTGEALMLMGFVVAIVAMTFFQQQRSEHALEALRDLSSPVAKVMRDGKVSTVDGRQLVTGDLALLAEGDRIPADMDLHQSANLQVDESMLTGESVPVDKTPADAIAPVQGVATALDRSRVYAGTLVTRGTAQGVVVATGAKSALGEIGESLNALKSQPTAVQQETRRVVVGVAVVGLALAGILALLYGLIQGQWLQGLLAGLTLAMAILPEELPVILTLFLGLGAWRLAQQHVLARSIPAIETLGATTVLCVDKTGTLTVNKMSVQRLWALQGTVEHHYPGDPQPAHPSPPPPLPKALQALLIGAVRASQRRAFDPMETAIADAGHQLLNPSDLAPLDLTHDYPLSPELLAMSRVWHDRSAGENWLIATKGAPEAIIDLCHLDADAAAAVTAQVAQFAEQGLRVLGVAQSHWVKAQLPPGQHDFDFEFLGLVALQDPIRPEVPQAIAQCHQAGIRVVMITGDHPATALAIAKQAGFPEGGKVLTGTELDTLSDAQLKQRLASTTLFCRARPAHKLRLVRALQAQGEIVAMTGDGVNDAPALKAANIGVAMGARGTEVARQAAALVLLKDDFSSLVDAVRHGRRVFANLRKAIVFVIAVHLPIIGLSLLPVLMGWPMLLMPVHVLFLELIIDPACAMVFEAQPLEPGAMHEKPRPLNQRLFQREVVLKGFLQGLGALAVLLVVVMATRAYTGSDLQARTITFGVLVVSTLLLIQTNRSWLPAWAPGGGQRADRGLHGTFLWLVLGATAVLMLVASLPGLQTLFGFVQPTPVALGIGALAVVLFVVWLFLVKRMGQGRAVVS